MKRLGKLALLAALLLLPVSEARANLITNGGFESPALGFGTFGTFASIAGWTTSSGPGIEVQNHVAGDPYEGAQHVELDSGSNSAMYSAAFASVAGQSYYFSYAYSPRPGVAADSNDVIVFFNGSFLQSHTADGTANTNTSWTVFSHIVLATSSSSTVEFAAGGTSDSLGGYLDDVQVHVVPEPGTLILLGSGLAGFAARRRARKLA